MKVEPNRYIQKISSTTYLKTPGIMISEDPKSLHLSHSKEELNEIDISKNEVALTYVIKAKGLVVRDEL